MPTRTATAHWEGGLANGKGQAVLKSSGQGSFDVSFPTRAADEANGHTSPEELLGAAHAACFAMQLSGVLEEAGTPPQSLDVSADVTLAPGGAGFIVKGIKLTLRGTADGVSADDFAAAAEKAKQICPVSAALAGTEITLDAALA